MPRRRNPPYLLPGDPEYRSDHSSHSLPHDAPSEESYDEYGQPRAGGVGQGAPLDENGRDIYSQVGISDFATPSPTRNRSSSHHEGRQSLKRKFSEDNANDPLPQTPRRFASLLSHTRSGMKSVPLVPPHAPKRYHLRAPFSLRDSQVSRIDRLERLVAELRQELNAGLARQTEVLTEVLQVLRSENKD